MWRSKILVCSSLVALLSACGGTKHQTLGSLEYEREEEKPIEFKKMGHKEVRAEYEELLNLFEDKQLKEQIERRIADVYMMEGVQKQSTNAPRPKSYYVEAIKSYREVLDKYPNSPDNAEVLYQLAKAYDMEGRQDEALKMLERLTSRHPGYPNIAEAYFRMGDIYFSLQKYKQAEQAYTSVTNLKLDKFNINAHYMLGWTYYKQYRFRKSLSAFAYVLNNSLNNASDLDTLPKGKKAMVEDALHSISLAFDKEGGPEVIASIPEVAKKRYAWMLYKGLGDYYLGKELFEQSAEAYRLYVTKHPKSHRAPVLHQKLVDTYMQGKFIKQALREKENYVAAYGVYSSFPGNKNGIRKDIEPVIKKYLQELAENHRADGKDLIASLEKTGPGKVLPKNRARVKKDGLVSLDKAAKFYQQYIDTFPTDSQIDQMRFKKAESLFDAGLFEQAIKDFELVAYQPVGTSAKKEASGAGYAAMICYEKVIASLKNGSNEQKSWQAKAVESMLRFAGKFDKHEKSPQVLTNAAEYMFSLNQYQRAIDTTSKLIAGNKALDRNLKKTAYGIMGVSYFKLERYKEAEVNYLAQRSLVPAKSEEYVTITENLATSIYKNSQKIEASGDKAAAAKEFLRIKKLAPDSKARPNAQYDAVALLTELEMWTSVIPEVIELQAKYPKHKMAVEFPRTLAFAYEKSGQWLKSANAYMVVHEKDPDSNKRREALFHSAHMQEKNKNYTEAAKLFKRYAYAYEKPFDMRMEARYHAAINYGHLNEIDKQQYWLRRIIDGDKKAGSRRTDRSKWLSAWANMEYGKYFEQEFRKSRLWLPLNKSLPKKQEFFQWAIQRYQSAAGYGHLEFVTESSYKIGILYQVFAKELRTSRIPGGLSQDDRVLYKQIIEEQAAPLDEIAYEAHLANVSRVWEGDYNPWIVKSFDEMKKLHPARFDKRELIVSYGDEIR